MSKRGQRRSARQTQSIVGNLMLAPMVAAMRLPMIAAEAQRSVPLGTESMRAVTEKFSAVGEGMVAAQLSYLRAVTSFWPEVMSGRTPSLLTGVATERSVNAALAPAGRTVRAKS